MTDEAAVSKPKRNSQEPTTEEVFTALFETIFATYARRLGGSVRSS